MLLMVIRSLPNLQLPGPSKHSDINANVIQNQIKHIKRAHELMFRNNSVGYAIA
jgi:hypothetical protein